MKAKLIFSLFLILAALVLVISLRSCKSEAQVAKLQELQSLAVEIPKYPDFKQARYSDIYRSSKAVVTYWYDSASRPEPVRGFYVKELATRGWTVENSDNSFGKSDNPLTFHKGKYKIVLTHDDLLKQYSLDFIWGD